MKYLFIVLALSACQMTTPPVHERPDRSERVERVERNGFAPACTLDGRRCHGGGKPDPMRPSAGCDHPSIYRPCTLGGPK